VRGLLLLLALLVPLPAAASAIQRGANEVVASGSLNHTEYSERNWSATSVHLSAGFLRAVTDAAQVGGALLLRHESFDTGPGSDLRGGSAGIEALARLNFGDSPRIVPFAQAGIGVTMWVGDFERDTETWLLPELTLGVRFLVHDLASFNLGLSWLHEFNALSRRDLEANSIVLGFGFSIFPQGLDGRR